MACAVSLAGVSRLYGARAVLNGITRDFEGINLITGANGSGKSTLLRLVAGLVRPSRGSVRTEGAIGYLAHAPFVYPGMSARENLLFWAGAAKFAGIDVEAALARMDLLKAANVRARIFSRGMLQRLGLARAFLGDPQILLLDEPASGLDSAARALLRREILLAANRGACVLMVSHDAEDRDFAGHVFVLRRGQLEEA